MFRRMLHSKLSPWNHALIGGSLFAFTLQAYNLPKLEQSPRFQGIPVAATLVIFQALEPFSSKFPGLEMAGFFAPGQQGHEYNENSIFYPSECTITIPVYERFSVREEERLGKALLSKPTVGHLIMVGECKVGCATAKLKSMVLYKVTLDQKTDFDSIIWSYST